MVTSVTVTMRYLGYPWIRNDIISEMKVYFIGSEKQPGVMRAQKPEIQISRETDIFSIKKFTFRSFSMELEAFFAIIQQT
jgi:hypothetical protein